MNKIIIYAPGVVSYGGVILLKDLINNLKKFDLLLYIDSSLKNDFPVYRSFYINNSLIDKFSSQFKLKKYRKDDIVLCFHSLPLSIKIEAKTIIFFHNIELIKKPDLFTDNFNSILKKLYFYLFKKSCLSYVVQTFTVKNKLEKYFNDKSISISKFNFIPKTTYPKKLIKKKWDLIYPSSGDKHKNHQKLNEALKILDSQKIKLKIVLTLAQNEFNYFYSSYNFKYISLINSGPLLRESCLENVMASKALIFPSKYESFGLPLIEASKMHIPIIASELDFVRDVCNPIQTFDPNSAISIARAINRFFGNKSTIENINYTSQFIKFLEGQSNA